MRLAFISALIACSLAASASETVEQQQVRAPVNVLTRLYVDCLVSKAQSARDIEPTRVGIAEFVEAADDWCIAWAVIWFKPLVGFDIMDRPDVADRFTHRRLAALQQLTDELRDLALINR